MDDKYTSSTTNSDYCYKDSYILKNKLNIKDQCKLKSVEKKITFLKLDGLYEKPILGKFDSKYLKEIHKFLFDDIYEFAGKFRNENIEKTTPVYTRFIDYELIDKSLKLLFVQLQEENYLTDCSKKEFINKSSYYLGELNYIHPFREGNGRTVREFYRNLALFNGYSVDWWKVSKEDIITSFINATFKEYDALKIVLSRIIYKPFK